MNLTIGWELKEKLPITCEFIDLVLGDSEEPTPHIAGKLKTILAMNYEQPETIDINILNIDKNILNMVQLLFSMEIATSDECYIHAGKVITKERIQNVLNEMKQKAVVRYFALDGRFVVRELASLGGSQFLSKRQLDAIGLPSADP